MARFEIRRLVEGLRARHLGSAWDSWSQVDPYWAVLTEPARRNGHWLDHKAEFFCSGDDDVRDMCRIASELALGLRYGRALDYGCGLGRVTQALGAMFHEVDGVDVAPGMITEARALHGSLENVSFRHVSRLRPPSEGSYDLVWSVYVLQHLGSELAIRMKLRELAGLVRSGGLLVVEVPHRLAGTTLRSRIAVRTKVFTVLRELGIDQRWLYSQLRLYPAMSMTALPEDEVRRELSRAGLEVAFVDRRASSDSDPTEYRRYFGVKPSDASVEDPPAVVAG